MFVVFGRLSVCGCREGSVVEMVVSYLCFQAGDGVRDLVRSRGLGDVYKRQEDTDQI